MEEYLYDEHPRPNTDGAPLFHKSEGWSKGKDDDRSTTPALVRQRLERLVEFVAKNRQNRVLTTGTGV